MAITKSRTTDIEGTGGMYLLAALTCAAMGAAIPTLGPIPILAVLCLLALVMLAFRSPSFGLKMLFITTPFVSIGAIPIFSFGGQTAPITPNELLLPLTIISWLGWKIMREGSIASDSISHAVAIFFLVGIAALVSNLSNLSGKEFLVATLYLIRWVEYAFVYLIVRDLAQSEQRIRTIAVYMVVSGLFVAVVGFVQLIMFPNLSELAAMADGIAAFHGLDPHRNRLVSLFLEPNHLSAYLSICFFLAIAMATTFNRRASKIGWAVTAIIILAALALTQSRAGFMMLVVGAFAVSKKRGRTVTVLTTALIVLVLVLLPAGRQKIVGLFSAQSSSAQTVKLPGGVRLKMDASAYARISCFSEAANVVASYPVLGCGYNAYRYACTRVNHLSSSEGRGKAGASCSWLTILATTGLIGLTAFTLLQIKLAQMAWRASRSPNKTASALGMALLASTIGLAVHSVSIDSMLFPQTMFMLWILAGLTAAAEKLEETKAQKEVCE